MEEKKRRRAVWVTPPMTDRQWARVIGYFEKRDITVGRWLADALKKELEGEEW